MPPLRSQPSRASRKLTEVSPRLPHPPILRLHCWWFHCRTPPLCMTVPSKKPCVTPRRYHKRCVSYSRVLMKAHACSLVRPRPQESPRRSRPGLHMILWVYLRNLCHVRGPKSDSKQGPTKGAPWTVALIIYELKLRVGGDGAVSRVLTRGHLFFGCTPPF